MLHIIWPKLLTGENLPDVGYAFWVSYLWRWIIKGVAGYSLYFPVLQTLRHNADQGNFSSPKLKGMFLLFVRNSQPLLVLLQFKVPITFGWGAGAPSGISGDCLWGYGCCGKSMQLFPGKIFSSVCSAHVKSIHAGHSLRQRKSKILEMALGAGPSPPPFQAEEQPCVYGVWAGFKQEECGWQGGRKTAEGTGCRNWQQRSPCSLSFVLTQHRNIFWLPSLLSKLREGYLLS